MELLSDYHDSLGRAIGKAHTFQALADFQGIIRRTKVENQNLIVPLMCTFLKLAFEHCVFACVQLTQEHAELDMVAPVPQGLEHTIAAFVVGDIVSDEVASPHSSPGLHAVIGPDLSPDPSRQQLGLQTNDGPPTAAVIEDRVGDQLIESAFVGPDEGLAGGGFHGAAGLGDPETPFPNHAGVDGRDDGRVHRGRAEFLHQIQSQAGPAVARLMIEAPIRT